MSSSWMSTFAPYKPSRRTIVVCVLSFLTICVFLELQFPFLRHSAKHWSGDVVCTHPGPPRQQLMEAARGAGQRALIIGSSNLVGRALADYLNTHLKLQVVGVDEVASDVPTRTYTEKIGSLKDRSFLASVISGSFDVVYHVTSVNGTALDPSALVTLVSLAAASGVQSFVFLSSSEVSTVEMTADRLVVPGRHLVGLVAAELVVRANSAMNTLIVRAPLHGVYGPGLRWLRGSVIDDILDDILSGREVAVGPQNQQLAFTYVNDLVPALALAPYAHLDTHILYLGSEVMYSVRNMARDLSKALELANVHGQWKLPPFRAHFTGDSHAPLPAEASPNLRMLIRKARCHLGEVAAMGTGLDTGLRQLVVWLQSAEARVSFAPYTSIVRAAEGTRAITPEPSCTAPGGGASTVRTPSALSPPPSPPKAPEPEYHVCTIGTSNLLFHAYAMTNAMLANCPRCWVHLILLDVPVLRFTLFHPRVKVYHTTIDQRIIDMGPKGAGGDGTFMKWWIPEITGLDRYWWVDIDNFPLPSVQKVFEAHDHQECVLQEELGMTHGALFHCYLGMNALEMFYKYQPEARKYVASKGWGLSDQPLMDYFARTGKINATITRMGIHNCFSSKDRPFHFVHVSGKKEETPVIFSKCVQDVS